ncbi:TPA: peptide ABC transporter substrate-binding protein [Streptococcus pneumoniae]
MVLSTSAILVACGKTDKEADAPTTFSYVYAVDPASLGYSIATRTSTTDVIGNVIDGLMENDKYGNVAPSQKDYDLNSTGWAPSYQDPASYLNIMDPKSGSAMKHLGITKGKDKDVVAKPDLDKYKKLLEDAVSEITDLEKRYEKYAKAQAWSTDSSLLMPTASSGGSPVVSNVVPFSKPYSQVGIKGEPYIFKGMKLQKDIVTTKEYNEVFKKWQKEKLESNSKYQKELEKHIK